MTPRFLTDQTAVLLAVAPATEEERGAPGRENRLEEPARRLWQELLRRLDEGEIRLYAEELSGVLGLSLPALGEAFAVLRRVGLADWDDPGPYLYVRRSGPDHPADGGVQPAPPSSGVGGPPYGAELAQVYRALEQATGQPVNPLELPRLQEWLSVLGLAEVLDEIALCRERGPCRFSRISFALDRACNRRRRISAFGPLHGHGVLPGTPPAGGLAGAGTPTAVEAVPNVTAYDRVPPATVREWMAAHPELYADLPPAPPAAPEDGEGRERRRPAAWADAYDPVPAEVVRRWAEAFSADYAAYHREYRLLTKKARKGPFQRGLRQR